VGWDARCVGVVVVPISSRGTKKKVSDLERRGKGRRIGRTNRDTAVEKSDISPVRLKKANLCGETKERGKQNYTSLPGRKQGISR